MRTISEEDFRKKMVMLAEEGYENNEQVQAVFYCWTEFFDVNQFTDPRVEPLICEICKAYGIDERDEEVSASFASIL